MLLFVCVVAFLSVLQLDPALFCVTVGCCFFCHSWILLFLCVTVGCCFFCVTAGSCSFCVLQLDVAIFVLQLDPALFCVLQWDVADQAVSCFSNVSLRIKDLTQGNRNLFRPIQMLIRI